jgi:hypothetical protein
LVEAVEGFFEAASPSEVRRRLKTETYVMPIMPAIPPGDRSKQRGCKVPRLLVLSGREACKIMAQHGF